MDIAVASGKGGTGKTTVASNLALSLENVQLVDCDVEEPNSHIFVKPEIQEKESVEIQVPKVLYEMCDFCGKCAEVCAYNAIAVVNEEVIIFSDLCHGCGACSYLCPKDAMVEKGKEIGYIERGVKGEIEFIHGYLNMGELMAPPLIRKEKEFIKDEKTTIIDAPPGTSCPVITSINNSDFVILVTEPTPFGLSDLKMSLGVVSKLEIPAGIIINRSDMGDDKVLNYCKKNGIPVLAEIPFSRDIAVAYSNGIPIVEEIPEYRSTFKEILEKIEVLLNETNSDN